MRRGAALLLILLGTLWGAGGATAQAPPTVPHFFFGTETQVTLDGVTYTESPVLLVASTPNGEPLAEVQVDLPVRQWSLNVPVGAGQTEILFELANSRERDTVLGTTEPFAIEAGGLTEVKALDFVSGPRFREHPSVQGVAGRGQLLDAPPIPTDEEINDREAGMGKVNPDDPAPNKPATPVLPPAVRETTANEGPAVLTDGSSCGDRTVEIHDGWNAIGWTGPETSLADALTRVAFDIGPIGTPTLQITLSPGLVTAQAAITDGTSNTYDGLAFRWDAGSQGFGRNDVRLPATLQGFTQVGRDEALWTRFSVQDAAGNTGTDLVLPAVQQISNWTIPIASAEARTVALVPGWNFVVWTGPLTPPEEAFADVEIHNALSQAFTWDAAGQRYVTYTETLPQVLRTMPDLVYGQAIWLLAKTSYSWTMPSADLACGDAALLPDFDQGDAAIYMGLPQPALQTAAAGDFRTFRNTEVIQGTNTTRIGEPTASNDRNAILYVGNVHAEVSLNNGMTWQFIDPYANGFPAPAAGGTFCCDQLSVFDNETGRIFWVQQYRKDTSGENTIRLVVYEDKAALETQTYCTYDYTPQTFGAGASRWFDFNQMQVTDKWLYLSSNRYLRTTLPIVGAVDIKEGGIVWRLEKDDFSSSCGGVTTQSHFELFVYGIALTDQTHDTGSTIYWAIHGGGHILLNIRRATDNSTSITEFARRISAFPASGRGQMVCTAPDGTNPCGRFNRRIATGWLSNGQVGFMWSAGQNAAAGWPFPHTRVAIFRTSDMTLVAEPHIWSSKYAWVMPTVGVNKRGDIAGPVYIMGGGRYPTAQAFIWDSYSGAPTPWENYRLRTGNDAPDGQGTGAQANGRFGDYGGSVAYDNCRGTWLVSFYTMQDGGTNDDAEHRSAWIGREEDGCADLTVAALAFLVMLGGDQLLVGETTRNIGSGPASASITRYYLSKNQTKGSADTLLAGDHAVPILAAGASHPNLDLLSVPDGIAPGAYYLIACADDPSTVTEITQTNNCTATDSQVTVTGTLIAVGPTKIPWPSADSYDQLVRNTLS